MKAVLKQLIFYSSCASCNISALLFISCNCWFGESSSCGHHSFSTGSFGGL